MYVAHMETTNFSFIALGATEDEAVDAMIQTMRRHRAQYGVEAWHPGHYPGGIDRYGLDVYPEDDGEWLRWLAVDWYTCRVVGPLEPGKPGTRDGEEISL